MKLLSIIVPCYNSQDYLSRCIESLLSEGDEIEILIVDDGSTDDTAAIADEFQRQYPTVVRVIHKTNGGHGSGINVGIVQAKGIYFKVVDSDDWVDTSAFKELVSVLRGFAQSKIEIDLLISNYVYEKVGVKTTAIGYAGIIPQNKIIGWDEVRNFKKGHYILMHAATYRTQLLRDCKLKLPEHIFYVDNLYVYTPLTLVKTLYYLNVDLYRYFIGRDDQSIKETVMIRRIDQQIQVNKLLFQQAEVQDIENRRLQKYMTNYLEIVTTVTSILLMRSGTKDNIQKKIDLWKFIQNNYPWEYAQLRWGFIGRLINMKTCVGKKLSLIGYRVVRYLVGFS